MKQSDFVAIFAERNNYTKHDAAIIVRDFVNTLAEVLVGGESVSLYRFGEFEIKEYKQRRGYDVSSGETIDFPAFMMPKFVPSPILKEAVKTGKLDV